MTNGSRGICLVFSLPSAGQLRKELIREYGLAGVGGEEEGHDLSDVLRQPSH